MSTGEGYLVIRLDVPDEFKYYLELLESMQLQTAIDTENGQVVIQGHIDIQD